MKVSGREELKGSVSIHSMVALEEVMEISLTVLGNRGESSSERKKIKRLLSTHV